MVVNTFNPSTPLGRQRQRQVGLSEFQDSQGYKEKPCLKTNKQKIPPFLQGRAKQGFLSLMLPVIHCIPQIKIGVVRYLEACFHTTETIVELETHTTHLGAHLMTRGTLV